MDKKGIENERKTSIQPRVLQSMCKISNTLILSLVFVQVPVVKVYHRDHDYLLSVMVVVMFFMLKHHILSILELKQLERVEENAQNSSQLYIIQR